MQYQQQQQQQEFFNAKVYFKPGNQVRRLRVVNSNFQDLKEHLKQLYQSYALSNATSSSIELQVLYLDSEKDWVSVNTEPEWIDALYFFKKEQLEKEPQLLRLKVIVTQNGSRVNEPTDNSGEQQAQQPAFHRHVVCDGCDKHGIEGTRYKCNNCPDFDLCGDCYEQRQSGNLKHDAAHEFTAIEQPIWRGCPWGGRGGNGWFGGRGGGRGPWGGGRGRNGCHWAGGRGPWGGKGKFCNGWGARGGWENLVNQFATGVAQQAEQQNKSGENNVNPLGDLVNNLINEFANVATEQQEPEENVDPQEAVQPEKTDEPQEQEQKQAEPEHTTVPQFNPEQLGNLVNGFLGAFLPNLNQQQQQAQPQQPVVENQYEEQLNALASMGFVDRDLNIKLLNTFKGDLSRVVARLLE